VQRVDRVDVQDWNLEAHIRAVLQDSMSGQFGVQVAINGDTAIIESRLVDSTTCAVYTAHRTVSPDFETASRRIENKLATNDVRNDRFGNAVAANGTRFAVGADLAQWLANWG